MSGLVAKRAYNLRLQQGVVMHGQQPGVQQQQVQPMVLVAPVAPAVTVAAGAGTVVSQGKAKSKKATVCWKCAVNTHATKDCTAHHFCSVCNNTEHPTMRCPTLRLPRPSAFTSGFGTDDTLFCSYRIVCLRSTFPRPAPPLLWFRLLVSRSQQSPFRV